MSQPTVTENLWEAVRSELLKLLPRDIFETWFSRIYCVSEGQDTLILRAPNDFAAIWLQDNYMDVIRNHVCRMANRPLAIVMEGQGEEADSPERAEASVSGQPRVTESAGRVTERRTRTRERLLINPRNTFENFIVGSSNQLAHAASLAIAKTPGRAYNPLFLYGETGLGKTHLMHAIAHAMGGEAKDNHIVYASCEKFTNEFMRAIQENSLPRFRKFYRGVDILLIDDIQFLEGKERTQEEFFHTFNELFESGRQICLSSDRAASEISKLEARLISRFQWGMVTDIQAPDLETRMAILRKKANAINFEIPQDILEFLAQKITRNVRRMEGALIKVATTTSLLKSELTIETTERLIHDILQEEAANQVNIEKIQKMIVDYYELHMSDMVSRRRPSHIAFPRQVAMYLARLLTHQPLKEIGDAFGGRDHGTVIHACKTVENIMEQDESVRRSVEYLSQKLSTQG